MHSLYLDVSSLNIRPLSGRGPIDIRQKFFDVTLLTWTNPGAVRGEMGGSGLGGAPLPILA